jgi:hypothetical protein
LGIGIYLAELRCAGLLRKWEGPASSTPLALAWLDDHILSSHRCALEPPTVRGNYSGARDPLNGLGSGTGPHLEGRLTARRAGEQRLTRAPLAVAGDECVWARWQVTGRRVAPRDASAGAKIIRNGWSQRFWRVLASAMLLWRRGGKVADVWAPLSLRGHLSVVYFNAVNTWRQ